MAKELNKFMLSAIAIIGLTIIILVGIAISTAFSKELRTETTLSENTTVTTSLQAVNVSTRLSNLPFLQSLDICYNGSNGATLTSDNFTISEGDKTGGTLTLIMNNAGVGWVGNSLNCSSIEYLANSDGQIVADKFSTGLGIFGTFAVIIILAIVGKAIISLFRKKD